MVDDRGGLLSAAIPRRSERALEFLLGVTRHTHGAREARRASVFELVLHVVRQFVGVARGVNLRVVLLLPRLLRHQGKHAPGAEILADRSVSHEARPHEHELAAFQHGAHHAGLGVHSPILRAGVPGVRRRDGIYSFFAMVCLSCVVLPFETWKAPKSRKAWER